MHILIAGGTGFIGAPLVTRLRNRGDDVAVLTRKPSTGASDVNWSPPNVDAALTEAVARADAIINLAGEPIADKRWSDAQKQKILQSRLDATGALVDAIRAADTQPKVLVSGSAIGFYGSRGSESLTESSGPGTGFLPAVVRQWEEAAQAAAEVGVRVAVVRTGIVLGPGGGALPRMAMPFKFFGGGVMGPRDQMVSWIHIDDEIGIIVKTLDDEQASGPVNATAPNPVTMEEFSKAIGKTLHRPAWVPALPTMMSVVLGERTDVVFASLKVLPEKALGLGYRFKYDQVTDALTTVL